MENALNALMHESGKLVIWLLCGQYNSIVVYWQCYENDNFINVDTVIVVAYFINPESLPLRSLPWSIFLPYWLHSHGFFLKGEQHRKTWCWSYKIWCIGLSYQTLGYNSLNVQVIFKPSNIQRVSSDPHLLLLQLWWWWLLLFRDYKTK